MPGCKKKRIKPKYVNEEGAADTSNKEAGTSDSRLVSEASPSDCTTGEDDKPKDQKGIKILEALAASGLRSIRYALEIPRVESVLANDFSEKAFRSIQTNVEHNGVNGKVVPSLREASMLMYEHRDPVTERFDVIDLDPYGSPSQFLDSTVQSVKDGGEWEPLIRIE